MINIDRQFGDWYKTIDPELNEDRLKKRLSALAKFSEKADLGKALDAVRLFFGLKCKDNDFDTWLREIFYKEDNTFASSGIENEMKVLAGTAAIRFAFSEASVNQSIAITQVITSVYCKGLGPKAPIIDIVQIAQDSLRRFQVISAI